MISLDQINKAIWQGFYAVATIGVPMPETDFLAAKISDTWPQTPPPTAWSSFWYDAVAVEIQSNFIAMGMFLPGFDGDWLNNNQGKKWSDLATMAFTPSPGNTGLIPYSKATGKG
jgi:hypothetical protein